MEKIILPFVNYRRDTYAIYSMLFENAPSIAIDQGNSLCFCQSAFFFFNSFNGEHNVGEHKTETSRTRILKLINSFGGENWYAHLLMRARARLLECDRVSGNPSLCALRDDSTERRDNYKFESRATIVHYRKSKEWKQHSIKATTHGHWSIVSELFPKTHQQGSERLWMQNRKLTASNRKRDIRIWSRTSWWWFVCFYCARRHVSHVRGSTTARTFRSLGGQFERQQMVDLKLVSRQTLALKSMPNNLCFANKCFGKYVCVQCLPTCIWKRKTLATRGRGRTKRKNVCAQTESISAPLFAFHRTASI